MKSPILAVFVALIPLPAFAHATGQGFVALLPTGPYMAFGVLIVALSMILLWLLPQRPLSRMLPGVDLGAIAAPPWLRRTTSLISFIVLLWMLYQGFHGPSDPVENALVMGFWVVFWMAAVMVQGLVFDLWGWVSPWHWLDAPARSGAGRKGGRFKPLFHLPTVFGVWPAVLLLVGFAGFTLADPAPDDAARLARAGLIYLVITLVGCGVFGPRAWLRQVEVFSVLMRLITRLAPVARRGRRLRLGWHGHQLHQGAGCYRGTAVLILVLLAVGSFDGLNETFFWLDHIGVNPLDHPGRTELVIPVLTGLGASVLGLIAVFMLISIAGERLARDDLYGVSPSRMITTLAPTVLPIALAYHGAHYLPSQLVDGQYALIIANDPLRNGADLLGLKGYYVTTGFFNNRDSMQMIWLTQAGVIVLGHVLAVILAHTSMVTLYQDRRRAFLAGLPLALFMIAYTWLGLWLLASPKAG